jgi:hypothetical protein
MKDASCWCTVDVDGHIVTARICIWEGEGTELKSMEDRITRGKLSMLPTSSVAIFTEDPKLAKSFFSSLS